MSSHPMRARRGADGERSQYHAPMSRALAGLAVWLTLQGVAAAQQPSTPADDATPPAAPTRAAALAAAREAREATLAPESRTLVERALFFVEEERVLQRLNPPEGFYPVVGSLVRGGGLAGGVGYRQQPWHDRLLVDVAGAWSYKDYRQAQLNVSAPRLGGGPIDVGAGVRWYDFPQEDFFGLGPATSRVDRVSFTLRGTDTFVQAMARRKGWLVSRVRAGRHGYDLASGEDPRFPSVEARFDDAAAPGLAETPSLRYVEGALGVDTRDQAGNTRSGGLYSVTLGAYRDGAANAFDFNRIDVKFLHVIPIFDKKRGIALHAAASRIDPIGASRVPFFLMPTVGGADSLRGFREFRFRDAAAIVMNAEYRWEAFSGLDLALFVDAGDVGPTWRSLVGKQLRSAWGVGFRFNTNRHVFLRVDAAGGREGPRIWVAMGPVFRR